MRINRVRATRARRLAALGAAPSGCDAPCSDSSAARCAAGQPRASGALRWQGPLERPAARVQGQVPRRGRQRLRRAVPRRLRPGRRRAAGRSARAAARGRSRRGGARAATASIERAQPARPAAAARAVREPRGRRRARTRSDSRPTRARPRSPPPTSSCSSSASSSAWPRATGRDGLDLPPTRGGLVARRSRARTSRRSTLAVRTLDELEQLAARPAPHARPPTPICF